ncbi:MetQ/NlpA family ABC transporter substrate-binding protein [Pectobacterium brasiliense]|uniref:MetQ/NlpA family ABC transporter substrate-binding protein n=1 Tax=Pectobacterium brasiliense TaxID=180957 RepID=UPI000CE6987B|nr:MetQ/NlpA family ABC transporter substrate-binding protein [Pectobacterium brasiliense]MBN3068031.1 metal ABC transporter substrate-binding protein [Pectobacterium brasiliense]MBN3115825.1 metal ABC transporter substrate-binding protein [Pectobacterium brasiliense]MBN3182395.1 metal ABC transporter substrate-binding protein [Pectobacterium brasiliense]MBN3245335.1 metal ABC transporter substrate-binding protein [Pectobacterium brasiliense]MDG0806020.1 MetQ/NlpA family ABC transporter substr
MRLKKLIPLMLALGISQAYAADSGKEITIGVSPGPYGDMVTKAIKPEMVKKGYEVKVREFSDYIQPNLALSNNSIDANLFQNRRYLDRFSADKGLKLAEVITVPTASMGFYSNKVRSLDELKAGDIVTLPNDPSNLARSLDFLQKYGLIKINPEITPTKASLRDITENPKGLVFKPLEAAQLPRALGGVTGSLINANFAISAGLNLSDAIQLDVLPEDLKNMIVVRAEDADKPFAQDLKAAVQSPEFAAFFEDKNSMFHAFQKPEWMKKKGTQSE